MRKISPLLVLGLAAMPSIAPAQCMPRVLQCEDCTQQQMESLAIALGQINGGSFHVFSLDRKVLSRYWVDYDHDAKRWNATLVPTHDGVADVFGHMLEAHADRPSAFTGRQVFRADAGAIGGGAHDPVRVSIRGEHDSAYGLFIDSARQCFGSEACAAGIDPALAAMLLAEQRGLENGFSLFRGTPGEVAWEGPPPRLEALLCNADDDCARLDYRDREWVYVETRTDGGQGKRYPKYGDAAHYDFDNAAAAASFERSLRNAGGLVEGKWQIGAVLACETAYASTSCSFRLPPAN